MPFCRTQPNTPSMSVNDNDTNHTQAAVHTLHTHTYIYITNSKHTNCIMYVLKQIYSTYNKCIKM